MPQVAMESEDKRRPDKLDQCILICKLLYTSNYLPLNTKQFIGSFRPRASCHQIMSCLSFSSSIASVLFSFQHVRTLGLTQGAT